MNNSRGKFYASSLLGFLILFNFCCIKAQSSPLVKIDQGSLQGIQLISRNGKSYDAFHNIPYVYKPERFHPPSLDKPAIWEGVRDGTTPGPRCIQHDQVMNKTTGSEDCLSINVYTPSVRSTKSNYNVLVYIHGGGFRWGAGHIHGAKYFLDEEVILCTFNYRLGPFGFISTGDSAIQGNMGLKDQVAALRWIKHNIKAFGGDPESVTIFGESAGGAAVSLLYISPMSKGLFKNAISQSGANLDCWATMKTGAARMATDELAQNVNCPTGNSEDLLVCLKSKSAEEIVKHTLSKWYIDPTIVHRPVIEQLLPGQSESDVFLASYPYDILKAGDFEPLPWLSGVCEDEGIYLHSAPILKDANLVADLNNKWNEVAPITLMYGENETVTDELNIVSEKIKKFYFQDQEIGEDTRQALTDLYSDRYFVHGLTITAPMKARHGAPVYLYILTFKGSFSFLQQRGFEKGYGVGHKDDLQYFFDGIGPDLKPGAEQQISEDLIKTWIHFAKTGTPSTIKQWEKLSDDEITGKIPLRWLLIDKEKKMVDEHFVKRMKFWDDLLSQHETVMAPRKIVSTVNVKEEL